MKWLHSEFVPIVCHCTKLGATLQLCHILDCMFVCSNNMNVCYEFGGYYFSMDSVYKSK